MPTNQALLAKIKAIDDLRTAQQDFTGALFDLHEMFQAREDWSGREGGMLRMHVFTVLKKYGLVD